MKRLIKKNRHNLQLVLPDYVLELYYYYDDTIADTYDDTNWLLKPGFFLDKIPEHLPTRNWRILKFWAKFLEFFVKFLEFFVKFL